MSRRHEWVAVIGPSPESHGGIANVIAQIGTIEMPPAGPRLVFVTSFRGGGGIAKIRSWLVGWLRFATLCALQRPALSYVHISAGASTIRKASFIVLSRVTGVPVLLHIHPASFYDQLEAAGIVGGVARRCVRASAAVIVLAESLVDRIAAVDASLDVHVVANAPDVNEASAADPPDGRVPGRVLFVGSFVDDKGVDVLLQAAAEIAPDVPSLRLALAGSGGEEQALRGSAAAPPLAGRTEFLGWIGGRSLELEYAHAALFVLPSRTEGLPLALLEAMWHGAPCIATTVGAIPEALSDGAGELVPAGDAAALATTIRSLLENPARAAAIGAKGAERVRTRYAPSRQRREIRRLLLRYAGAPAAEATARGSGVAAETTAEGASQR